MVRKFVTQEEIQAFKDVKYLSDPSKYREYHSVGEDLKVYFGML